MGATVAEPRRGPIVIARYDPGWVEQYEAARDEIVAAVGEQIEAIEHIGATSVPELAGKPVIDIQVAVADWDEAKATVEPLTALGWVYRGEHGIPRRHYFVRSDGDGLHTHHLHILETTSAEWRDQLLFRDYLRSHPEIAADYAALKRVLAARHGDDREAYADAKTSFVGRIVGLARAEAGARAARGCRTRSGARC